MTTSTIIHHASDGSDLQAILSLAAIKSLSPAQTTALNSLGIRRVSDLLQFKPVHDARLVVLAASGRIAHDLSLADLLSPAGAALAVGSLAEAPTTSLASVSQAAADLLVKEFGVQTVAQLAQFGPFLEAQRFLAPAGDVFREPASAPEELMPQMIGSIESVATYSTFVKENTLRIDDLNLVYDQGRQHYVDSPLADLFPVFKALSISNFTQSSRAAPTADPDVVLHLGFASKSTQRWINTGTSLGEITFSLALAPGESRNIAILDWTRSQRTQRGEDTTASEKITNNLFHTRALDECTTVTAIEHQNGGTLLAAGTLATAGAEVASRALVGGVAGIIPGAAIGAAVGAVAGLVTGPGDLATTLAGAGAGAVVGFGIGAAAAVGTAALDAKNAQLGIVRTDTSGDRQVINDVHQDISERISQNASNIRSLRSNIFVTDEQSESQTLTGRNITNYNHSHMLNLQYYEVLQRYRSELRLTAAEPLLYLPFRPLDFTVELIMEYWSILRSGVTDVKLRSKFDLIVGFGIEKAQRSEAESLEHITVFITRPTFGQNPFAFLQNNQPLAVRLLIRGEDSRNLASLNRTPAAQMGFSLSLAAEPLEFAKVSGFQVDNLAPNEEVFLDIRLRLEDDEIRSSRSLSVSRIERQARQDGSLVFELGAGGAGGTNPPEAPSTAVLDEMERYFNARRYFFTRLLLLSIEKEQIIDLVDALMFQSRSVLRLSAGNSNLRVLTRANAFTSRQPLPDLVLQGLAGDIESMLTSGLRAAGARPAFTNKEIQQISQGIINKLKDILADPANRGKTADQLATIVKNETRAFLLSAKIVAASANAISQVIANAFRKRFSSLQTVPGVTTAAVYLTEFIEPEPLAITGNTLVFRMKKIQNSAVQQNALAMQHLTALLAHPKAIEDFTLQKSKEIKAQDVFLPTNGVFAEAILGRANASEKVDATRYINWLDMPIPNAAPRVADLQLQQLRGEPLQTDVTVPGSVINISTPPAFPDTTAREALSVLNNGNLFRDMSRSDVLAGVLNNLSSLANNQSQQAGSLAGQAQQEALRQAAAIANKVADLTAQFAQNTPPPPVTDTQKAGLLNQILKLLGVDSAGLGGLPGAGAVDGGAAAPGGSGGTPGAGAAGAESGVPAAGSAPSGQPAVDVLEKTERALGISAPAAPAGPAAPAPVENSAITILAVVEDPLGNPISFTPMILETLINGISQTTVMGSPNFPLPMNVRDQAGALRAVTPNLEATLQLPKNGQGKVTLVAAASETVNLLGEGSVQLGINQDRFVILRVKVTADQVIVAAANETAAKQGALELAAADDGSNFPFALGAKLKDAADLLRAVPGPQPGDFTVLAPDGGLEIRQLTR